MGITEYELTKIFPEEFKSSLPTIEEIENELHLSLHPMTWPINSGKEFKGVYNLDDKSLRLFNIS